MFGYSGQLNTRCDALVAQGSPAELNQPPILFNAKKTGSFLKPVNLFDEKSLL